MITQINIYKKNFTNQAGNASIHCRYPNKFFVIYRCLTLFTFLLPFFSTTAQELPVYQKYVLHPAIINPAAMGSGDCSVFKLADRHQWVGIEGAPRTQMFCAETTIKNEKTRWHGLGAHIYYDANGANKQLGANLGYSFHFLINRQHDLKLGMGLMGSIYQASLDEQNFSPIYDPIVTNSIERELKPNANTGVFLYNDFFFVGLSAVQLLPTTSTLNAYKNTTNYYFHAGFLTGNKSKRLTYFPSIMLKANSDQEKQLDLNTKFIYQDNYWLLFSYRHVFSPMAGGPNSFLTYVGIDYGNFSFAYGMDIGLTNLQRYHFGSHEFMVSYKICKEKFLCPVYR